jgi:hypothetical protein
VSPLELGQIRATSPTLAETMRACFLRAGLSRVAASSKFVLGNPKAWLGAAYHEVVEKIVAVDLEQETLDAAVERLWKQAIATLQQRADAHPLNCRFGLPTTWPGYHVARASVSLRAEGLLAGLPPATALGAMQTSGAGFSGSRRERDFTACDGKLLGRPDVVRADEIVDYKSGAIVEYDEATQSDVVKDAYIRQLRIYGYLVKETLGWCPLRGLLLPFAGAGIEVALDSLECAREATEAVALLDAYNGKVRAGASPRELASPSPQGCRWCPFKLLCPAFWQAASPEWSGQLDGAAVGGVLAEAPSTIHAGAARAVALDIQGGSEARCRAQIAPLNPATHPGVITLAAGDHIRLVCLRARRDGVLVPGERTVLCRVAELPLVTMVWRPQGVQYDA